MDQQTPPNPPSSDQPTPPPPPRPAPQPQAQPYPCTVQIVEKKPGVFRKIIRTIFILLFILSVIINLTLASAIRTQMGTPLRQRVIRSGQPDQIVAVYKVAGVIREKTSQRFQKFCKAVTDNKSIKGVLIRVDSPGGSIAPSDQINTLVKKLREQRKIPVVVSMGGMAASGGYYISASATEIYAEPTTLTGSIGVIMAWPVLKGTLDKIGIEPVVLRSTGARGWKDEISQVRKPDQRQRQHLQEMLDKMHEKFQQVVIDGRGEKLKTKDISYSLSVEQEDETKTIAHKETAPFNGKIYMAEEALDLGMIDTIGYMCDAIDRTIELAGVQNPTVIEYKPAISLFDGFLSGEGEARLGMDLKETLQEVQTPRIEVRWRPE